MNDLVIIITAILFIYVLYWMYSTLKTLKAQRVLIATLTVVMKKIAEKQNVDIDLAQISDDIMKKLK